MVGQKARKSRIISTIDLGSETIRTVLFYNDGMKKQVIGYGEATNTGLCRGAVSNMSELRDALDQSVRQAEHSSSEKVREPVIALSSHLLMDRQMAQASIKDKIRNKDLHEIRAKVESIEWSGEFERVNLHILPIDYNVDGAVWTPDPMDMYAHYLTATMGRLSAPVTIVENIKLCIKRAGITPGPMIGSPLADMSAILRGDLQSSSALIVNMGADQTIYSLISAGKVLASGVVPIAGGLITSDLSVGLSMSFSDADAIKKTFGNVVRKSMSVDKLADMAGVVGTMDDQNQTRKSFISTIIKLRLEDIVDEIKSGLSDQLGADLWQGRVGKIYLTGGAANLVGLADFFEARFSRPTFVAGPEILSKDIEGYPDFFGPAFSVCLGAALFDHRLFTDTGKNSSWRRTFSDLFFPRT